MGKNKGITLISLVITIIILLILAGVAIDQLTERGLFEKAKLAKEKSENAQIKENETLGEYENKIGEYVINENKNSADIEESKNPGTEVIPILLVPDMTSSTSPSGKVTASYENGEYKAWYAFSTLQCADGYSWSAWPNGAGSWIMYQFENPIRLKKIKLKSHDIYSAVENFTVYGSNDGTNFEEVYKGTHGDNADLEEFELSMYSNWYQYLKLVIDSVYDNAAITLDKVEYYGIIE